MSCIASCRASACVSTSPRRPVRTSRPLQPRTSTILAARHTMPPPFAKAVPTGGKQNQLRGEPRPALMAEPMFDHVAATLGTTSWPVALPSHLAWAKAAPPAPPQSTHLPIPPPLPAFDVTATATAHRHGQPRWATAIAKDSDKRRFRTRVATQFPSIGEAQLLEIIPNRRVAVAMA